MTKIDLMLFYYCKVTLWAGSSSPEQSFYTIMKIMRPLRGHKMGRFYHLKTLKNAYVHD